MVVRFGLLRLLAPLLILGTSSCGGAHERVQNTPQQGVNAEISVPTTAPDLTQGEDILPDVLARSGDEYLRPLKTFREGHVTSQPLPSSAVAKSEGAFRVQLPSGAPVITPTVYEDLVITSGGFQSRQMYAFRARDGEPVWGIGLDDDGPSNAACKDDVCVFNTESCTIFAVHAATGELMWSWYLGDPLMSAPTIANGLVFAAYPTAGAPIDPAQLEEGQTPPVIPPGVSHALAAFDLQTGELRWTHWIEAEVITAPVAIFDAVYVSTYGGTMYKFQQDSGDILAARRLDATSAPTFINGRGYTSQRRSRGDQTTEGVLALKPDGNVAFDGRDADYLNEDFQQGTQYDFASEANDAGNGFAGGAPAAANVARARRLIGRDTVHGLQEYQGSWVLGLGMNAFSTMGDALVSYDRNTGRQRWSVALPGNLAEVGGTLGAPPAAAGGQLVVATASGQVLIVDPEDGAVRQSLEVGSPMRTQAVVDRGWVYVGTADGKLVGMDTGNPSLTGWTTWAGNAARTGEPSAQ